MIPSGNATWIPHQPQPFTPLPVQHASAASHSQHQTQLFHPAQVMMAQQQHIPHPQSHPQPVQYHHVLAPPPHQAPGGSVGAYFPSQDPNAFLFTGGSQSSDQASYISLGGHGTSGGDATYYYAPQQHQQSANSISQGSLHATQPYAMAPPPQASGVTLSSLLGQPPQHSSPMGFPLPTSTGHQQVNGVPQGSYVIVHQLPPTPPTQGPPPPSPPVMQYGGIPPPMTGGASSPTQFIFHNTGNSGSGSSFLVADGNVSGHLQQLSQPQSPYQLSGPQQPHQQPMQFITTAAYAGAPPQGMYAVPQGNTQQQVALMMPPPPPPYGSPNAQYHPFITSANDGSQHSLGRPSGPLVEPKKSKRNKKRKDIMLTPRSQALKDHDAKEREEEKANRGGRPFAEEPFELDNTKKQLIVNFLSHAVTEAEFTQVFSQFGPISAARIIYDKHTNRSKGYGFVYFKNGDDAIKAILELNGVDIHSKLIKVSYATPQRPTPPLTPRDGVPVPDEAAENRATGGTESDGSSSDDESDN